MNEAKQTIGEELFVPVPPDRLWPYVVEAGHIQRWYAFGGARVDARPGGAVAFRWDEHGEFTGTVDSVEPGRLFAFRWEPGADPLVRVTLEPSGEGTLVRITESGDLEDAELSAMAWRNSLELLRDLATGS